MCEKRGPATPSVRAMFSDQRTTRERWFQWLLGGVDGGGGGGQRGRGGRAGPALECIFHLSLSFVFSPLSNFSNKPGEEEKGDPATTGHAGLWSRKNGHVKKPPPLLWQRRSRM